MLSIQRGAFREWIDADTWCVTDVLRIAGETMKSALPLLAVLLPVCLAWAGNAAELEVSRADAVRPDPELAATVSELGSLAAKGGGKNIAKVEAFFAPKVKVFTRSLDPFQPWNPVEGLTGNYLSGVADVMVEQGEIEAGLPVPDYRLEAMKRIASLIGDGATFGTLPEMPGAVCAPAAYKVDRKAALAFARKFELDAYSLRFHPDDVFLADRPRGKRGTLVPPNTLMMFDHDPRAPEGWGLYETAGGVKGYMEDRDDTLGLAQNHVCFAKVKGRYRITAVFGYGL